MCWYRLPITAKKAVLSPWKAAPCVEAHIGLAVCLPGSDGKQHGGDARRDLEVGKEFKLLRIRRPEVRRQFLPDLDLHKAASPSAIRASARLYSGSSRHPQLSHSLSACCKAAVRAAGSLRPSSHAWAGTAISSQPDAANVSMNLSEFFHRFLILLGAGCLSGKIRIPYGLPEYNRKAQKSIRRSSPRFLSCQVQHFPGIGAGQVGDMVARDEVGPKRPPGPQCPGGSPAYKLGPLPPAFGSAYGSRPGRRSGRYG